MQANSLPARTEDNMPVSFTRREFIKSSFLFGLSIALAGPARTLLPSGGDFVVRNRLFAVAFGTRSGTVDVRRHDGSTLLAGATAGINFAAGATVQKRLLSDGGFGFAADTTAFEDKLGRGTRLTIRCTDARKLADVDLHLSLYDELQALTFEATCTNASQDDLAIHSLEPLRAVTNEHGVLHARGVSKCLTNGEMYFDAGTVHAFGDKEGAITSGHLKGVSLANGPFPGKSETIHSWWNAGLFCGHEREGIALGYVENTLCLGNLLISRSADDRISFLAQSVYPPSVTLRPGSSIGSNRVMIEIADDPCRALESYAAAVGKANDARTKSILNGWCSWF